MAVGGLSAEQVRAVLLAAVAAPSLHNSQPWRFRCTAETIEVHADFGRRLPAADPDHRELHLACGAALLNIRLAGRAVGAATAVQVLPDPRLPGLLAVIRPMGRISPTSADQELAAAIFRRHTNRRPFSDDPVPEPVHHRLRQAARVEQAWLAVVPPAQQSALRGLLAEAHRHQLRNPLFVTEWADWTGRDDTVDGVPARSTGPRREQQDMWVLRDFSGGRSRPRVTGKDFESDPLIAVIGSFHDLPSAQVQAGQAMQRVLLAATVDGLSASFLSQVVEVPAARHQLRDLIGGGVWPQAVLRIGYGTPAPPTPRRDLGEVVDIETALPEPSGV